MKSRKPPLCILVATALGVSANSFGADGAVSQLPLPTTTVAQQPDVPLPIVDKQTTTSTLSVAESGTVNTIAVTVDIQHTWVGDLDIGLKSPDGTVVVLLDRPGVPPGHGCRDNNMFVRFDDAASFSSGELENHCAPAPAVPLL